MSVSAAPSPPRVALDGAGDAACARASGLWTTAQFAQPAVLDRLLDELKAADGRTHWDLGDTQLDHVGAQLLWDSWGRRWPAGLVSSPPQQRLLERVAAYATPTPARRRLRPSDLVMELGESVLSAWSHAQGFVRLLGQLAINLLRLLRAPAEGPWRDFSGHLYRIGATALPITALVGFLIGVVLAYLTAQQLRQFGADAFIVNILGLSLIRELGPMLAAILVAGRSGSAITAQIGVMRVTEELDAMRVMGISHSYRLVMPRVIALALAMPLISVWTTLCALAGGMLAADVTLGITPTFFLQTLPEAVRVSNLTLACAKSAVFGVLIASIGCHYGLRVKPNTQSLGEGTTASVVTAITVVILVDALFAVLFKDVGL